MPSRANAPAVGGAAGRSAASALAAAAAISVSDIDACTGGVVAVEAVRSIGAAPVPVPCSETGVSSDTCGCGAAVAVPGVYVTGSVVSAGVDIGEGPIPATSTGGIHRGEPALLLAAVDSTVPPDEGGFRGTTPPPSALALRQRSPLPKLPTEGIGDWKFSVTLDGTCGNWGDCAPAVATVALPGPLIVALDALESSVGSTFAVGSDAIEGCMLLFCGARWKSPSSTTGVLFTTPLGACASPPCIGELAGMYRGSMGAGRGLPETEEGASGIDTMLMSGEEK